MSPGAAAGALHRCAHPSGAEGSFPQPAQAHAVMKEKIQERTFRSGSYSLASHGRWERSVPRMSRLRLLLLLPASPALPPAKVAAASPQPSRALEAASRKWRLPTGSETQLARADTANLGTPRQAHERGAGRIKPLQASWVVLPDRGGRLVRAEEVRLLTVNDFIHASWKTNAVSVFPRLYCLPACSLPNNKTLSMET